MQIQWAIPCRYAEEVNGTGNFLGAGWDTFRAETLPAQIHLSVALNTTVPEHELGSAEDIDIEVFDPAMDATDGGTITVRLEDYPGRPAGRQPSTLGVIRVSLEAETYGQYSINLRLQGRVTSIPVFVVPEG